MTQPRTETDAAARTIAAGGNPPFKRTYPHPKHGELTFRGKLPLAIDSLKLAIAVDNLIQGLEGFASHQTTVLSNVIAALTVPDGNPAGKGLLLDLPIVGEKVEDEGTDSERTIRTYYDVRTEPDIAFLGTLWNDYSTWRLGLLSDDTARAVGKSSGAPSTSSDGSSTPSASATEPPSTTPAS